MTAMDAVRALGAQKRALAVPAKAMILASIRGRMCLVPATRGPRRCSPRPIDRALEAKYYRNPEEGG